MYWAPAYFVVYPYGQKNGELQSEFKEGRNNYGDWDNESWEIDLTKYASIAGERTRGLSQTYAEILPHNITTQVEEDLG